MGNCNIYPQIECAENPFDRFSHLDHLLSTLCNQQTDPYDHTINLTAEEILKLLPDNVVELDLGNTVIKRVSDNNKGEVWGIDNLISYTNSLLEQISSAGYEESSFPGEFLG